MNYILKNNFIVTITINDIDYRIDLAKHHVISSELNFSGAQSNLYDVDSAVSKPLSYQDKFANIELGGSCNAATLHFVPHCHGTHTECIQHITQTEITVNKLVLEPFIPCTVISVTPQRLSESNEQYSGRHEKDDLIITAADLAHQLKNIPKAFTSALAIRSQDANTRPYNTYGEDNIPPYFSDEAAEYLVSVRIMHVLVEIPSIDRIFDGGQLTNHHKFWCLDKNSSCKPRSTSTVTEMIYLGKSVGDGCYFLNLQLPDIASDALPCRPILYAFNSVTPQATV